tara:strand:- start:228 stop:680 length:453 start_codon:yes stop_codon:yes gene_type:complete
LCGDRPCINKAERKEYFAKNMIIEVKKSEQNERKNVSEINQIVDQALIKNKKVKKYNKELAKEEKYKKKELKRREKELTKQIRLENKRKKKEQRKLAKLAKKNKKIKIPNVKVIQTHNAKNNLDDFQKIVENIYKRNLKKEYPDINEIPK